jgi:putative thioredoxin
LAAVRKEGPVDVTEATFNAEVIERSREVPVVVDFWAAWCGPCRQLGPIIEAIAERRAGEVVLAKVDIDANPGLARQYEIMSIPAVKGFRDGVVVDEFVGMQHPPTIEAFFNRVIPSAVEKLVALGDEDSLREAIVRDAGHTPARVALGRILLDTDRLDEAVDVLRPAAHDLDAAGLLARAELRSLEMPDVAAALAALDRDDREAALTHLLDAVRASTGDTRDTVRQAMIGVFRELGDQHPLTVRFRRRLSQALY